MTDSEIFYKDAEYWFSKCTGPYPSSETVERLAALECKFGCHVDAAGCYLSAGPGRHELVTRMWFALLISEAIR